MQPGRGLHAGALGAGGGPAGGVRRGAAGGVAGSKAVCVRGAREGCSGCGSSSWPARLPVPQVSLRPYAFLHATPHAKQVHVEQQVPAPPIGRCRPCPHASLALALPLPRMPASLPGCPPPRSLRLPLPQADTGTKMIHVGKNTRSRIVSKGISAGRSRNCYRGLVQVGKGGMAAEPQEGGFRGERAVRGQCGWRRRCWCLDQGPPAGSGTLGHGAGPEARRNGW